MSNYFIKFLFFFEVVFRYTNFVFSKIGDCFDFVFKFIDIYDSRQRQFQIFHDHLIKNEVQWNSVITNSVVNEHSVITNRFLE
jgi:hypothetical protein